MDIVDIVQIRRTGIELVARTRIHVVAKWDRDQFYREVYRIETLLHITCQIISESKHPRFCFPRFVSIWPAPEVVDGIFEVCTAATKFCPLVNKPVALGFSLWWQLFDISKQFCPLVRLGPNKTIILLNLAEYRLILAVCIRRYSARFHRIIVNYLPLSNSRENGVQVCIRDKWRNHPN